MIRLGQSCILLAVVGLVQLAQAHESRPAYLELNETTAGRYDVLWRTPLNAGMRLPIILKLPDDAAMWSNHPYANCPTHSSSVTFIKVTRRHGWKADRFCWTASNHH